MLKIKIITIILFSADTGFKTKKKFSEERMVKYITIKLRLNQFNVICGNIVT